MQTHSRRVIVALAVFGALGCDQPTPVAHDVPALQFDFMNGPTDLGNVFRSERLFLVGWSDFASDLTILINAKDDPTDLTRCGGSDFPELIPVQRVGELQDVIKALRLLRDVNIHIYRPALQIVPTGFPNPGTTFCEATFIAKGTGNMTSADNDVNVTGPGMNAFGFWAQGTVELVSGGSARVDAAAAFLVRLDDEADRFFKVLTLRVGMHPVDAP